MQTILDGSNIQPEAAWHFPSDDLFTPMERRRGLPIGNQTSHFFANVDVNVDVNGLDHFVKEELRVPGYIWYVDDMLVFDHEKTRVHEALAALREYGASLRLRLHARKCVIGPTRVGVLFLGQRIIPSHRRLDADNVRRFTRRLRQYEARVHQGSLSPEQARCRVQSWVGHAKQAETVRLRKRLFSGRVGAVFSCRP